MSALATARASAIVVIAFCLASCSRTASALEPRGLGAAQISALIWLFTGVCALVWVVVMAALVAGLARRNAPETPLALDPSRERHYQRAIIVAVCVTAAAIVALSLLSFYTSRGLARFDGTPRTTIDITGHQWWWEAKYSDLEPERVFTTANEIHVPVNEMVELRLRSADVIHSFWTPNLAGKEDLVPGQQNVLRILVSRPGVYRGQCAEFCGLQHAHMAVYVIAEPREEFDIWRENQLRPASPGEGRRQPGERIFTSSPCAMCHRVSGTTAAATTGPDLTHVGSRRTIGAGALQMTRANLAAWIANAQAIKPGVNMPRIDLDSDDLDRLVDYLEGLK